MLNEKHIKRLLNLFDETYLKTKKIDKELNSFDMVDFIDDETFLTPEAKVIMGDYTTDKKEIENKLRSFNGVSNVELYVNVYEVERRYGGPEEGGWFFNNYELIEYADVIGFSNALDLVSELNSKYKDLAHGDIYSVNGGIDYIVLIENEKGASETLEVPQYE